MTVRIKKADVNLKEGASKRNVKKYGSKENMNENGWVKITVSKNSKGQGSSWLDEWKPKEGAGTPVNSGGGSDDLPF